MSQSILFFEEYMFELLKGQMYVSL